MTRRPPYRPARSIGAAPLTVLERAREGTDQHGRVVGSFRQGHYVTFGSTVFAIGRGAIHAGPLHLLYTGPVPILRTNAPITMTPERLLARRVEIDLRRATPWTPLPIDADELRSSLELLERVCPAVRPVDLHVDWSAVEQAAAHDDLTDLRVLLEGRGPGLTPVGDDVLAGAILLRSLVDPCDRRLRTLAQATATSTLSRGFLYWAGRGQSIEPVHRLIRQASVGNECAARQTASIIATIGASSGQALLAGLGLAARSLHVGCDTRASRPQVENPSRS